MKSHASLWAALLVVSVLGGGCFRNKPVTGMVIGGVTAGIGGLLLVAPSGSCSGQDPGSNVGCGTAGGGGALIGFGLLLTGLVVGGVHTIWYLSDDPAPAPAPAPAAPAPALH